MDHTTVTAMRNEALSKLVEYDQSDLGQYGLCELLRLHYLIDVYFIISRVLEVTGDGSKGLAQVRELLVEFKMQSRPDRHELVKTLRA